MLEELVPFGKTVPEVLSRRGEAEDWELLSNIAAILWDKEERQGFDSLTRTERFALVIDGVQREVNNGGFDQFFSNSSGRLGADLLPALDAVGSTEFRSIAADALEIFGEPTSWEGDEREAHQASITEDYELSLWDDCDGRFYECGEQLETRAIDYLSANLNDVDA